jgi:hypothetical protein
MELRNEEILTAPVSKLDVSAEFKQQCSIMGFETLKEVTETEPAVLLEKRGFSYKWLGELIEFLSKHQLLEALQPLPGSSRG